MEMKDILRLIAEEMGENQINDVILAVGRGFERVHPQMELVCVAIPKNDEKERKEILRCMCRVLDREGQ